MKIYRDCKCNEDIIDTFTVSEKSCGVMCLGQAIGSNLWDLNNGEETSTRTQEEEWKFYGKIQLSEIRFTL